MREILLFIFLFSLVVCPYPLSTEKDFEPIRKEREKKLDGEIRECVLKEKISSVYKTLIQNSPEENLGKITYLKRGELTPKDKKTYQKCRKERHTKFMERYKTEKYYKLIEKGYRPPDPNENHDPIE